MSDYQTRRNEAKQRYVAWAKGRSGLSSRAEELYRPDLQEMLDEHVDDLSDLAGFILADALAHHERYADPLDDAKSQMMESAFLLGLSYGVDAFVNQLGDNFWDYIERRDVEYVDAVQELIDKALG